MGLRPALLRHEHPRVAHRSTGSEPGADLRPCIYSDQHVCNARVAESADAPGLGSGAREGVGVRIPPLAPFDPALGSLTCATALGDIHVPWGEGPWSSTSNPARDRAAFG